MHMLLYSKDILNKKQ